MSDSMAIRGVVIGADSLDVDVGAAEGPEQPKHFPSLPNGANQSRMTRGPPSARRCRAHDQERAGGLTDEGLAGRPDEHDGESTVQS